MSALICERCGTEIFPGSEVEMIGLDPDARIVVSDEVMVVHAVCPGATPGS